MKNPCDSDLANLLCSRNRYDIAVRLLDGPCQVRDLPGSATPAKIASMNPLIDSGLIEKDGHCYQLSNVGVAFVLSLKSMLDMEEVLADSFWRTHDLSSIPPPLLARIGALKGGSVVKPNGYLMKAQMNFIELVTHAKSIKGASSFNLPGYQEMITAALDHGANIELILSPAVMPTLDPEVLKSWQATGRFLLHVREVKAAVTIADNTLSLGLFGPAGVYDATQDFVCESEQAAEWGRELFEYYLKK